MHPLVRAVLFGVTGYDAFDPDPEPNPPPRQPRKSCQAGRSERTAIVRQDRSRQSVLTEDALECTARVRPFARRICIAGEQIAAHMIDNRQRVTVAVIAEEELSLVVDCHQVVRFNWLAAHAQRMCGRRTAFAWLHQVCSVKNVAGRARRRPLDVRMQLRESSNDLPRSHMWESATKRGDLLGHLVARSMRNVQRRTRPIDESFIPSRLCRASHLCSF